MPSSGAPIGTLIFTSSFLLNSTFYTIDSFALTNPFTATPSNLTSALVTPSSLLAYNVTTYTITFQPSHTIP